jgi:hypothetical protein
MGHRAVESIFHSWTGASDHRHQKDHEHHGDHCCGFGPDDLSLAEHDSGCGSSLCSENHHSDHYQDQKFLDDLLRESETFLVNDSVSSWDATWLSLVELYPYKTTDFGSWQQRGPPMGQQALTCLSKVRLLI